MVIDGKRMSELKGLKQRWVTNYILIVLVVMLLIEGLFIYLIKSYYYDSVEQSLINKAEVATGFYNKYLNIDTHNFNEEISKFIDQFSLNGYAEIQALNLDGEIIFNSTGFEQKQKISTNDFKNSLKGSTSSWIGKNIYSDEKIMAVSTPVKNYNNKTIGVIRFITSLEIVDNLIKRWVLISLLVIAIILVLMIILSTIFTKSVINPVKEITDASKKIAKGELSIKIDTLYNDEIGELADTINYMANELSKVEKMKSEFISSISHELRTPLTSIKGWSETILTGDLEDKEEAKLGLEIIIKESDRLTTMVEELLDFSRLEGGRISLNIEKINLNQTLAEVLCIFEGKGKQGKIEINYEDSKENIILKADKNRLKQVFINIIDNAIKFTEPGKRISIRLHQSKNLIFIDFIDEGMGISKEDIDKIKEKFYKGKSQKEGSGLGLAISNEIINLHGGNIEIKSEEKKGTHVRIILPNQN